jgi:membrane protease YdiL (CAAX protease family)
MGPGLVLSLLVIALFGAGIAKLVFLLQDASADPAAWTRGARRLLWRPFGLRDAGGVALVVVAASLLPLLFFPRAPEDAKLTFAHLLLNFVLFQVVLVAAAIALMRHRGLRWADAFGLPAAERRGLFSFSFGFLLAVIPVVMVVGVITNVVLMQFGIEPRTQEVLDLLTGLDSPAKLAAGIAFAAIGAPVSEEIFFRGLLLPALAKWTGVPAAVFASSLLFAAIHASPHQLLPLFVLSLALSLVTIRSGRLECAILLHALFNAFMLTLALVSARYVPV